MLIKIFKMFPSSRFAVLLLFTGIFCCQNAFARSVLSLSGDCNKVCQEPFIKIQNRCYLFDDQKELNWFNAMKECKKRNSTVVAIETEEEMKAVENVLLGGDFKIAGDFRWYWTSAYDPTMDGSYVWADTLESMTYTKWSEYEPNHVGIENCIALWKRNGQIYMNDLYCNFESYYICEMAPQHRSPNSIEDNCKDNDNDGDDEDEDSKETTVVEDIVENIKELDGNNNVLAEPDNCDNYELLEKKMQCYQANVMKKNIELQNLLLDQIQKLQTEFKNLKNDTDKFALNQYYLYRLLDER